MIFYYPKNNRKSSIRAYRVMYFKRIRQLFYFIFKLKFNCRILPDTVGESGEHQERQ